MILQALMTYYERLSAEDGAGIALEGFESKEIPFLIVIDRVGKFVNILDTRSGDDKKRRGRVFIVPKAVKKTSGIAANLLWDTPNYVFGRPKPDPKKDTEELLKRAQKQHECFVSTLRKKFQEPLTDEGIRAVINFLEGGEFIQVFNHPLWSEIEQNGANLTFKLEGDEGLVCERPAVMAAITGSEKAGEKQTCLVTGQPDFPVRLHTSIKGVRNAQSSGANIVSFNLDAFRSYGKEQGLNAPVGQKAEFAYTTALNHLLARDSRQRLQVGDATVIFWAEKQHPLENTFFQIFGYQPPSGEPEQDHKSLIALYRSPETGALTIVDPNTKFYVLGLSPNAARIAVRFWYDGTVGEVAENIGQHFKDLEIVKGPKEWQTIGLRWLLRSTALPNENLQKWDNNIAPNLAGDTVKSILTGAPYPQTLLAAVISRIRAEQSRKDASGKPLQNVGYTRAALIKAILVRENRYYKRNVKEVDMSLDTTNTSPGYLLGRLFAVLERAQESASPDINATIRDRYYGAASSTPVAVFPILMKLNKHHLAKLTQGQTVYFEKLNGEIMDKLDANEAFPSHLSLQEQGRFAVGYYHQRQDFFTKKDDKEAK